MKILLQRVIEASVKIDSNTLACIKRGLLLFVAMERGDEDSDLSFMAEKVLHLRVFPEKEKEGKRSVLDLGGEILVVSQFTLCADLAKGTRPSFSRAMQADLALNKINDFIEKLKTSGLKIESGRFGAKMQVFLINDGPYTLWLESKKRSGGSR